MATSALYSFSSQLQYGSLLIAGYAILSYFFYHDKWFGFSPSAKRRDGRQQFSSAYRHAAYYAIVLPLVNVTPIYLALKGFNFSLPQAVAYFWTVLTDPHFASKEIAVPLGPDASWLGNTYLVTFFLGGFHYWFNEPFRYDRVWHKVLACSFCGLGTWHGTSNRIVLFTTLLWKPSALLEAFVAMLHLSSLHRTRFAKICIPSLLVATSVFRFIVEFPWFYGCMMGVLPSLLAPEGPDWVLGVTGLLVGALTVLHVSWAFEALSKCFHQASAHSEHLAKAKSQ